MLVVILGAGAPGQSQPTVSPSVALGVSIGAAVIAGVALWRTHFQRFRLLAVVGELALSVYPIHSAGSKWYILSAEVPMTLTNSGARPGRLLAIRLNVRFPQLKVRRQRLLLAGHFTITDADPGHREHGRFVWLSIATERWRPHVLLPKESVTETVVFERRIEEPLVGVMEFRLEAFTKRPRGFGWWPWTRLAKWDFGMSPAIFGEMVLRRAGGGFATQPRGVPWTDEECRPPDLLDRVRFPADQLPVGPFAESSHLDYPAESARPPTDSSQLSAPTQRKARQKKARSGD